ncbi:MAG: 30S ribosomal protein S17 [Planctomycetota bacterium]|nr:MAG: 30S ribosomal protein S17 [Planctomycetota bacterium]
MSEVAVKTRGMRKIQIGLVISQSGDKTVRVVVSTKVKHPLIKKFVTKKFKFMVHDEKNEAKIGDTVKVMETRPLSKQKRWRLLEIVKH